MPPKQNHRGRIFGGITLTTPVPGKTGYWRGICSCGNAVEKRIDNLNRPGRHTCGRCYPTNPATDPTLEERVRRLEDALAKLTANASTETRPLPEKLHNMLAQYSSDESGEAREAIPSPKYSLYSNVTHDGEFWQARTLSNKVCFWGDTEEEAAFAARVYLESIPSESLDETTMVISEDQLTLSAMRREEIRHEVDNL